MGNPRNHAVGGSIEAFVFWWLWFGHGLFHAASSASGANHWEVDRPNMDSMAFTRPSSSSSKIPRKLVNGPLSTRTDWADVNFARCGGATIPRSSDRARISSIAHWGTIFARPLGCLRIAAMPFGFSSPGIRPSVGWAKIYRRNSGSIRFVRLGRRTSWRGARCGIPMSFRYLAARVS